MAKTKAPEVVIRYEGGGVGTELWGCTQANFLVAAPGQHAREVAVLLNDAAAAYLAAELGADNDEHFRAKVVRHVGEWWLQRKIAEGGHLDSVLMVSRAALEASPPPLPALKKAMKS
jgi:hypothetical protein